MRLSAWLVLLLLFAGPAEARPPAEHLALLRHGVNITGWFRYPGSLAPQALAGWMRDAAMRDLRRAGFTFVRLAVDPAVLDTPALREIAVSAVCRLQRQGLAVVVDAHPTRWHLEDSAEDRASLLAFWRAMAPALGRCDPHLTMPEILNEPVFPGNSAGWAALQHSILPGIRAALPDSTVVLTGPDWGSITGLLSLTPETDTNVIYSIHFYDPAELTGLAAYRPDLDRVALARLPFPTGEPQPCAAAVTAADEPTRALWLYYCASRWDGAAISGRVGAAADWARRHDTAVLVGEFGATAALNPIARLNWLSAARRAFEAANMGWALWGYDDIMGFQVTRPPGIPLLDTNILTALGLFGHPDGRLSPQ